MDAVELRDAVEVLLGVTEILTSGETITEDDLKGIDSVISEIKTKMVPEGDPKPMRYPTGHYVFEVSRTQVTTFSVEAKNIDSAYTKAAGYLHDNIEALRYTWDRRDPLSLSPLKLIKEPGDQ